MECKVSKLSENDIDKLQHLLLVYSDVFEWKNFAMPANTHLQTMLANPQHLVFVASLNHIIIGGLTAYILPEFETEYSMVYIYDLAVKTEYQRQGVGKQLIQTVRDYCSQQTHLTEVFVQADEEDEYAIDFYQKTGGREMQVRQFSYALNQ